jgi:hypothetical protein
MIFQNPFSECRTELTPANLKFRQEPQHNKLPAKLKAVTAMADNLRPDF